LLPGSGLELDLQPPAGLRAPTDNQNSPLTTLNPAV